MVFVSILKSEKKRVNVLSKVPLYFISGSITTRVNELGVHNP